jgi:acyl-coenzyme A synthetase/AMP-(fatty) acid ligase
VGWAAEHLSDYKAPRRIMVVDELPRTGTSKVQKDEVRELFT